MDLGRLYDYLLAKKGSTETFPFGDDTLVIKVMGKMFAAINLKEEPKRVNLKCDPERAVDLRESYASVTPGYHMSKRHWNTVYLDGDVPDKLLFEMVDHSYELVVAGLRKQDRDQLASL